MQSNDLYYKKYLKYKNKYLNLLNQIGGVYNKKGVITRIINDDTIIITYNKYSSGNANFVFIGNEIKNLTNLTSIQLINIVEFINHYYFSLQIMIPIIKRTVDKTILQRITTIICDNNNLNNVVPYIFYYIGELIKLFPTVSTLSFKSCNLNKKDAIKLKSVLMNLPNTINITEINLENNNELTPEIIDTFNEIIQKPKPKPKPKP